jgi:glycosyltransferase involved in cell wall biosynthesis
MITIIVPCYNEEHIISLFLDELEETLINLPYEIELILVDNNSSDLTWKIINESNIKFNNVKLIRFSNYFGKENAILAGLDHSSGKAAVIMDPDLEDPPNLIPNLINKWKEGYEIVYTIRSSEDIGLFKSFLKEIFYSILAFCSAPHKRIEKNSGDFKIIDRKIINIIKEMREKTRFFRGLINYVGFKKGSISFHRTFRKKGKSKSSLNFLINYSFDSLFSFSNVPINLIIRFGFLLFIFIIIFSSFLLFKNDNGIDQTTTIILFIGLVSSFNILAIGLVGEYISRIYNEVKNRPNYIIENIIHKKN